MSILLSGALSSCSEWLDVTPEDQIAEEQLYEQAQGYYNQLNGVYYNMSSPTLYGKDMTWGFMDILAQYYNTRHTLNDYSQIAGLYYDMDRVKVYFSRFWETMYNQIANCNNLIQNAEQADPNLFPGKKVEKDCIEGEARALRAMLHFDLLRMYAPAPAVDANGKHIPYVDYFPTHITKAMETSKVMDKIKEDLLKAHELTHKHDSLYGSMFSDLAYRFELRNNNRISRFFNHRGYHLNHYAIKGLLARVYHWEGDTENALKWSENVLKYVQARWISFNSEYDIKRKNNMKLYDDVMFAGYNNQLPKIEQQVNTEKYKFVAADYDNLFGADARNDYRRFQWAFDDDTNAYRAVKYEERDEDRDGKVNNLLIPLIRASEMFYIYAECVYDKDPAKARETLQYLRKRRGCRTGLGHDTDKDSFIQLILDDLRRELYGEGQLFFFYKRLGLDAIQDANNKLQYGDKFVFPIPESEDI